LNINVLVHEVNTTSKMKDNKVPLSMLKEKVRQWIKDTV